MRLTSPHTGRRGRALRRITGGAILATALLVPLLGLTTGNASAVTCQSGDTPDGTSNVCVPIFPGNPGSYPATLGSYPFWLTQGSSSSGCVEPSTASPCGTDTASSIDRSAGSDTTLFMMNALANLYDTAGLYGCQLTTNNADCDNTEGTLADSDIAQTDTIDNFDRTEITNGVNDIGSTYGLEQLCGSLATPDPVQFVRTAKPAVGAVNGCSLAQVGYAKDAVDALDFQSLSPGEFGSPSAFVGTSQDGVEWPTANSGEIGAPAAGWLPGNPVNCVPAGSGLSGTPCTGTAFTDVDNTPIVPGDDYSSLAYRLWCQSSTSGSSPSNTASDPRIEDWGELTNLTTGGQTTSAAISNSGPISSIPVTALTEAIDEPLNGTSGTTNIVLSGGGNTETFEVDSASSGATSLTLVSSTTPTYAFPAGSTITYAVGDGTPIGVPVHIVGINTGAGTVSTFSHFANSNTGNTGTSSCEDTALMDTNAAQGPNFITPVGTSGNAEIALQNNASQISTFGAADFPNDLPDQAVAVATSLYIESNGVYLSNPNAGLATLIPGTESPPSGVSLSYAMTETTLNGVTDTLAHEITNAFPVALTLFNAYETTNVNASVGAFLNWLCDSNSYFKKSTDPNSGENYDSEIANIITNEFEFPRLTDTRTELSNTTPADGVSGGAPNAQCDAALPSMVSTGGDTLTYEPGGTVTSIPSAAGFPSGNAVDSTTTTPTFPTGITVSSVSGSVMTVSGTIPAGTYNLYFPGMPPVLAVTNPNE